MTFRLLGRMFNFYLHNIIYLFIVGWKNNPVEFDSVINQSSIAWYWGDNDVINIFNYGSKNIKSYSYGTDYDFAGKDFSNLDKWVFDKVEKFLVEATTSEKLNKQLHREKLLFFLHLNGKP